MSSASSARLSASSTRCSNSDSCNKSNCSQALNPQYDLLTALQEICLNLHYYIRTYQANAKGKGKSVPSQAWSGPEGSRKLRFPNFMTTAQGSGKVVSHTHRTHLSPVNSPCTHFCYRLSRPQGHSAIGRIMSMKNSNDTIWNRTSDLPICSAAP